MTNQPTRPPQTGDIITMPGGRSARVVDAGMVDRPAQRADGSIYGLRYGVLIVEPGNA